MSTVIIAIKWLECDYQEVLEQFLSIPYSKFWCHKSSFWTRFIVMFGTNQSSEFHIPTVLLIV